MSITTLHVVPTPLEKVTRAIQRFKQCEAMLAEAEKELCRVVGVRPGRGFSVTVDDTYLVVIDDTPNATAKNNGKPLVKVGYVEATQPTPPQAA